jgi:enediyne biosynthesis protein E4
VDVLIMNQNEPPSLLRNDVTGGGHWLKVKLQGTVSNRSAIGARVTAVYGTKRQAREVMAQSSYMSCDDPRLHFGLGTETRATLEIRWPNGGTEVIKDVEADQLVVVKEGSGIIRHDKFSPAPKGS